MVYYEDTSFRFNLEQIFIKYLNIELIYIHTL